jgi:hypothetical protein
MLNNTNDFINTVCHGTLAQVKEAYQKISDPEVGDADGNTALHHSLFRVNSQLNKLSNINRTDNVIKNQLNDEIAISLEIIKFLLTNNFNIIIANNRHEMAIIFISGLVRNHYQHPIVDKFIKEFLETHSFTTKSLPKNTRQPQAKEATAPAASFAEQEIPIVSKPNTLTSSIQQPPVVPSADILPATTEKLNNLKALKPDYKQLFETQEKNRPWYKSGYFSVFLSILLLPFAPLIGYVWYNSRRKDTIQKVSLSDFEKSQIRYNRQRYKYNESLKKYLSWPAKNTVASKEKKIYYLHRSKVDRNKFFSATKILSTSETTKWLLQSKNENLDFDKAFRPKK